ncbi:hypothetical protein A9K97_gp337 [Tokyovirus A1]|uniref:hypothetical protein n=1 Tax=Tokyovirus A1 TaxID=1826170 RepID=UPI0007A98BA2|nr:hypothetical protein A9K97_gp337 [Tokyovirus A1]BAU80014.1 hypothetical protein [Tokyovirus A1]
MRLPIKATTMNSSPFIPQIGHSPSAVCDGTLSHKGNNLYGCECGGALISAFDVPLSSQSVIAEIIAINRAMNNKSKTLEQTHNEARKIMLGGAR